MRIQIGKYAGFCFGVDRAVRLVEEAAGKGDPVQTLGPIIHNHHVVERLARMGVEAVEDPTPGPAWRDSGAQAHGVPRDVEEALSSMPVRVVDATCPFVKRIHRLVQEAEAEGRVPVIIGSRIHPEVVGIASWCRTGVVLESARELEDWAKQPEISPDLPICLVSQTTLTANLWNLCVEIVKKQFTNFRIFDTICRATEYRQKKRQTCQKPVKLWLLWVMPKVPTRAASP